MAVSENVLKNLEQILKNAKKYVIRGDQNKRHLTPKWGDHHKEIVVGAQGFHRGASSPDYVLLSNNMNVLAFDKTTVQHAHFNTIIPPDYISGTDLAIEIDWAFGTAEADHYMTWVVEYLLVTDGDDPAGAITRVYKKSVISTSNNDKQLHMDFGNTIVDAVADDVLLIRLFRDAAATYDTDDLDQDAWLLALHFHYESDKNVKVRELTDFVTTLINDLKKQKILK